MCGEKEAFSPAEIRYWGSPPRVRGKAVRPDRKGHGQGITPAYAGKRCVYSAQNQSLRDHPRVCGEKGKEPGLIQKTEGSPPRVRGKAVQMGVRLVQPGITPAYAGKRAASAREAYFICGSPPRMRGKAYPSDFRFSRYGITPAYAGKSLTQSLLLYFTQDHPRVCGEK